MAKPIQHKIDSLEKRTANAVKTAQTLCQHWKDNIAILDRETQRTGEQFLMWFYHQIQPQHGNRALLLKVVQGKEKGYSLYCPWCQVSLEVWKDITVVRTLDFCTETCSNLYFNQDNQDPSQNEEDDDDQ